MNTPYKVYFVDDKGKTRYDILGSEKLAKEHAEAYVKAGYTNVTIFDLYRNMEIKINADFSTLS